MSRLMFSAPFSGSGKTTVTCAVLAALKARGKTAAAFKCGPDFIDPMFHRAALGLSAYNLDPFFLNEDGLRDHLAAHAKGISIIEGAMGFYDGVAATEEASAYTVAKSTQTPVVLVVDAKGAGASLAALLEGFLNHKEDSGVSGVIFNGAPNSRRGDLREIAQSAGLSFYGCFPRREGWEIPSRRLGLLTPKEIADIERILDEQQAQAENSLDIDGLLELASTAPDIGKPARVPLTGGGRPVKLALARDGAFCFMYAENLELLEKLNCEPVFFSPLHDEALPRGVSGLWLCGGYPELFAKALSDNSSMRDSIKRAVAAGLPTIAESGGFVYLHEEFLGLPMCGVFDVPAFETRRLKRFGYSTITALKDSMLCKAGESIRAHEFHYSESPCPGPAFLAQKAGRNSAWLCVHATDNLFAGFPHLYLLANPAFAENFVKRMGQYETERNAKAD